MLTYIWIFTLFFLVISIIYYLLHLDEPSTRINSNVPVRKEKIREKHSSFEIDGRKKATHADGTSYETNDNEITGNSGSSVDDDRHVDTLERHSDRRSIENKPQHKNEPVIRARTPKSTTELRQRKQIIEEIKGSTHLIVDTQYTSDELPDKRAQENDGDQETTDCISNSDGEESDNPDFDLVDEQNEENIFSAFVNEEKLLKKIKKHRTLHGMIRYIDANIQRWQMQTLKVAITGHSGAGKSSLINALRGIKPSEKDAAAVGITETTSEPKEYKYPNNNKVILVDLPGMGTLKFPREKYLKVINYKQYDVFIIVFTERVSENEIWLAGKLEEHKKHVMFVRTKIDIDLMNEKRDYPESFDEKRKLDVLRQDIQENLKRGKMALKANIFLISTADRQLYNFQEMDQTLRKLLNKKGIVICKMISRAVTKEIYAKRDACKSEFFFRKVGALLCEILPGFADTYFTNISISRIHEQCLYKFCLDEESRKKMSKLESETVSQELKIYSRNRFVLRWRWIDLIPYAIAFKFFSYFRMSVSIQTMCNGFAKCELQLVSEKLKQLQKQLEPLQSIRD